MLPPDAKGSAGQLSSDAGSASDTCLSSQDVLLDAVEAMAEGLVIFDGQSRMVYCNTPYRKLYAPIGETWKTGISIEQIARDTATHCLGITDPEELEPWLAERLKRFEEHSGPFEQQLLNGRWLRVNSARLPNGWSVGTRADITVQKEQAAELTDSRERFQTYAESASDWFWETDADLRWTELSEQIEHELGVPRDKILGRRRTDLDISDPHNADWQAHLGDLEARRPFREFEYSVKRANGETAWVRISGIPLFSDDGTFKGYRGAATNVTEHVRDRQARDAAENALRQERVALEQRLRELNHAHRKLEELTDQLVGARDEARAAYRAKSEFLATISHEIRTPMNGVIGTMELLSKTPLNEDQQKLGDIAKESANGLLDLLNNILDSSRLESGRLEIENVPYDIADLLRSVVAIHKAKAETNGLEIECRIDAELPDQVRGDPTKIRQILSNLIDNAIKFTENGTVEVSLAVEPHGQSNTRLRFEVSDSGIGLSSDARSKLFAPFVQAESSTSRKYGGSGLGLSICKKLVELMNGDIGVESEENRGSRFWFAVPMPVSDSCSPAEPTVSKVPEATEGASYKVLLVDDNTTNQFLFSRMLQNTGHDVEIANDGAEAVEMAARGGYDVVLMDIRMPGMNGIEATARIRQLGGPAAEVPVIGVTADVTEASKKEAMAAGFDEYLAKPITAASLINALHGAAEKMQRRVPQLKAV